MHKIDIERHFAALPAAQGLMTVATVNDTLVRLGTFSGSFAFHRHDDEDELFWVVSGAVTIELRDREIQLSAGEMLLVPRGIEHRTRTVGTAQVVVVHPRSTGAPGRAPAVPRPHPSRRTAPRSLVSLGKSAHHNFATGPGLARLGTTPNLFPRLPDG